MTEITFSKRFRFIIFDQSLNTSALIICNETCSEVCRKLNTCAVRVVAWAKCSFRGGWGVGLVLQFLSSGCKISWNAHKIYIFSSVESNNKSVNTPTQLCLLKIVATCFGQKGPPFCPADIYSTYTLGIVIQIGVAYRRGYVLRNESLGDFVVVRTP